MDPEDRAAWLQDDQLLRARAGHAGGVGRVASLGDAKKAARIIGGRVFVPKPEDFAQASAESFEAGYSRPGAAGVAIPCDGIREAADRSLRPRKSPARRRVRRPEARLALAAP
jgi:hypothetical protein